MHYKVCLLDVLKLFDLFLLLHNFLKKVVFKLLFHEVVELGEMVLRLLKMAVDLNQVLTNIDNGVLRGL